jgi:hypothetical protein
MSMSKASAQTMFVDHALSWKSPSELDVSRVQVIVTGATPAQPLASPEGQSFESIKVVSGLLLGGPYDARC